MVLVVGMHAVVCYDPVCKVYPTQEMLPCVNGLYEAEIQTYRATYNTGKMHLTFIALV